MAVEQRYQRRTVPTSGTADPGAVAEARNGAVRLGPTPDGALGPTRPSGAGGPAMLQVAPCRSADGDRDRPTLQPLAAPDRPPTAGRPHDVARMLGTLTERCTELPHLLLELSSELLAWQNERRSSGGDPGGPTLGSAIGEARFALAEATTAALVLVRRLDDAGRNLTDLTDLTDLADLTGATGAVP